MGKNSINRKSLAVVQLQYDISSKSLKTRAISEILAKTLYQHTGQPLGVSRLSSKAAGFAELVQIQNELTLDGLKWLKENGWVEEKSGGWQLTEGGKARIENRLTESDDRISNLLKKHFGLHIEHKVLRDWFQSASTAFFAEYGEVIFRTLLREQVSLPGRAQLQTILEECIKKFGLDTQRESLINGFYQFINDVDPKAEAQKMSFAVTTLSARLIAAATGPDPISLPEFERSRLFLDTNVLLLERIETTNEESSAALIALVKALDSIGASLHIIRLTKEEYESVIARKRTQIIKVLDGGVTLGVLEKSGDPFLRAAIKNQAQTKEDFIRFFDSVATAPTSIDGVQIELLDFPELEAEIQKTLLNKKLIHEIADEWKRLRGFEKKDVLAEHDAALNASALYYKKKSERVWIITRDRSMLNLSRRWHEHDGLPVWVYLHALVEILAVYGAGPTFKSEEFAPLLGALIRFDAQETFADFRLEDLGELVDIDARVFELSDDEVASFAQKLHQLALSGSDDTSNLQLHIKRTFQGRRLSDNKAAEQANAKIRDGEKSSR